MFLTVLNWYCFIILISNCLLLSKSLMPTKSDDCHSLHSTRAGGMTVGTQFSFFSISAELSFTKRGVRNTTTEPLNILFCLGARHRNKAISKLASWFQFQVPGMKFLNYLDLFQDVRVHFLKTKFVNIIDCSFSL